MSKHLRQVAFVCAGVVMTPQAAHARQVTPPGARGVASSARTSHDAGYPLGTWQGVLAVGAFRERLALIIRRDSVGTLQGTLRMMDQGGVELPAAVASHGDTLSFTIASQHITYSGVMTTPDDSVRGTFVQGDRSIPLTFGSSALGSEVVGRPQDPQPPYPYRAEEVTVPSDSGVRLAGTVVMPAGPGPFPAVVFVTGSGPQDRDEALMGHRPFLVIADYLARHGIASLRYDDRGFAKSTGSFETATSADFAADAEAALHFLQREQAILHSIEKRLGPLA